jgi:hypothetical protein
VLFLRKSGSTQLFSGLTLSYQWLLKITVLNPSSAPYETEGHLAQIIRCFFGGLIWLAPVFDAACVLMPGGGVD